jgi:hypothetical protein
MSWNRKTSRRDRKHRARTLAQDAAIFVDKLIAGSRKGGYFILLDRRTGLAYSPSHGCYAWEKSPRAHKLLDIVANSCNVRVCK